MSLPLSFEIIDQHIGLVSFGRPDVRNAVDRDLTEALSDVVETTELNDEIRCVILTGNGGQAFCAGADLNAVAAGQLDSLFTQNGFAGFTHAKRSKPWIAAVEGVAVAGGCEIALACDMIVASDEARFALPEVKRGLIASAGGVYRLPRSLPRNLAFEAITTGSFLSAARCHAFGMVNTITAPGSTLVEAIELARRICVNAPIAVRESLVVARAAFDSSDDELRAMSEEAQGRVRQTQDFLEGPRAFLEKRPPCWVNR